MVELKRLVLGTLLLYLFCTLRLQDVSTWCLFASFLARVREDPLEGAASTQDVSVSPPRLDAGAGSSEHSPSENQNAVFDGSLPELCVYLAGEAFRGGDKGVRSPWMLDDVWLVDEQKRASESQMEYLIKPLERMLNARAVLYLDSTDKSDFSGGGVTEQQREAARKRFVTKLESYYGGYWFDKVVWREWVDREGGGGNGGKGSSTLRRLMENGDGETTTLAPGSRIDEVERLFRERKLQSFLDPTRAWLADFHGDARCRAGLLQTRPDMVFKAALRDAILTSKHDVDYSSSGITTLETATSQQRFSFVHSKVLPLDLDRLLFLFPCWTKFNGDRIPSFLVNGGRWRVVDVWAFIPGRLLKDWDHNPDSQSPAFSSGKILQDLESTSWTAGRPSLPRIRLFRNHEAFAYFPNSKDWVKRNVGFVSLNSQHDSNTAVDWNPFYRFAGRMPIRPFNAGRPGQAPSRETEEYIKDLTVGFDGA